MNAKAILDYGFSMAVLYDHLTDKLCFLLFTKRYLAVTNNEVFTFPLGKCKTMRISF